MKTARRKEIDKAVKATMWGVILGTLGRQGSPKVLDNIQVRLANETTYREWQCAGTLSTGVKYSNPSTFEFFNYAKYNLD